MVAVAGALELGGARLHVHEATPPATMEAVASVLSPGGFLHLHSATPLATMVAVAQVLNSGAKLFFRFSYTACDD